MRFATDEFEKLKDALVLYDCALRKMNLRMDILLADYKKLKQRNPVEHIKTRLKSPESVARKLFNNGHTITAANAQTQLFDIAGLRIICYYARDIVDLADVLRRQPGITVLTEKDYVTHPKKSGYRSYHMIIEIPVYLTDSTINLPVEVQIRTQGMDFWASLEHQVRYKYQGEIPKHLYDELTDIASEVASLDERMYLIQELAGMAYRTEATSTDNVVRLPLPPAP